MVDELTQEQLIEQLHQLGIQSGDNVIVHTAFSKIKPIVDGPLGLIKALQIVLTSQGTLVMPSMTWDDETIFDPNFTPCPEMGIVAEMFWKQPDVLRSDNVHTFSAWGLHAQHITATQPLDIPHGMDSPVGRIYELDGKVLLLGIDQTANTTIHLAEELAPVRYRCKARIKILKEGQPSWFEYEEINHCCNKFQLVDEWLSEQGLIKTGMVGHGKARLMQSRDIVDVVTKKLQEDETIFLHPYGVDEECDEARASIPS